MSPDQLLSLNNLAFNLAEYLGRPQKRCRMPSAPTPWAAVRRRRRYARLGLLPARRHDQAIAGAAATARPDRHSAARGSRLPGRGKAGPARQFLDRALALDPACNPLRKSGAQGGTEVEPATPYRQHQACAQCSAAARKCRAGHRCRPDNARAEKPGPARHAEDAAPARRIVKATHCRTSSAALAGTASTAAHRHSEKDLREGFAQRVERIQPVVAPKRHVEERRRALAKHPARDDEVEWRPVRRG